MKLYKIEIFVKTGEPIVPAAMMSVSFILCSCDNKSGQTATMSGTSATISFGQAQPGAVVTFDGTHCNFTVLTIFTHFTTRMGNRSWIAPMYYSQMRLVSKLISLMQISSTCTTALPAQSCGGYADILCSRHRGLFKAASNKVWGFRDERRQ